MSTLLKQICTAEARLIELRMRVTAPGSYHDPRDIREMVELERNVRRLWPLRQYELAGASEAARIMTDAMMRHGNQGVRTDLREVEVGG